MRPNQTSCRGRPHRWQLEDRVNKSACRSDRCGSKSSRVSKPFDKRNTLFPKPDTLRLSIRSRFKIYHTEINELRKESEHAECTCALPFPPPSSPLPCFASADFASADLRILSHSCTFSAIRTGRFSLTCSRILCERGLNPCGSCWRTVCTLLTPHMRPAEIPKSSQRTDPRT